jgi:hypothetical protein
MKKQIKLTESDLHNIIKESVENIIKNINNDNLIEDARTQMMILEERYNRIKKCLEESYPRLKQYIYNTLSEYGLSSEEISTGKEGHQYAIYFDNVGDNINIKMLMNSFNLDINEYDLNNPEEIREILYEICWQIETIIKRDIYKMGFSNIELGIENNNKNNKYTVTFLFDVPFEIEETY